jgi:membrane associated rhomboid family serine protease
VIPLRDDNPRGSFPFVTVMLIAANVAVFVFEATLDASGYERFVLASGAIPSEIMSFSDAYPRALVPLPLTLVSSMFVHGGPLHLIGNMLYLWIFGDNVEDRMGHAKFLAFYIFTGVSATLTHIFLFQDSTMPLIGASGAIAGVLGAYFLIFPRAHVLTLVYFLIFVRIARIPAIIFLGIWFAMQVMSSALGGGIAWFAHIGGFAAGALLTALLVLPSMAKRRR